MLLLRRWLVGAGVRRRLAAFVWDGEGKREGRVSVRVYNMKRSPRLLHTRVRREEQAVWGLVVIAGEEHHHDHALWKKR